MTAESLGITFDERKASVDPVAVGCRKTTSPRISNLRSWVRFNGGAFKTAEGDLKLCR